MQLATPPRTSSSCAATRAVTRTLAAWSSGIWRASTRSTTPRTRPDRGSRMAEAHYEVSVPAPIDVLWAFCVDPANWVDLLRGYQSHELLDDKRSSWTVQVDIGPFSR